jgi:uncharacterized membrane protein
MFTNNQTEKKTSKWLIASLVLNVFLIGGLIGGAYHLLWSDHSVLTQKNGQRGLRFAAEYLSDDQQERFRDGLRQTRHDARPMIKAGMEARHHVRELLNAPAFDRAAITAEIAKIRESDVAVRIKLEENLINFAETLSPEERAKLVEGLTSRGPLRERAVPIN